MKVIDLHQDIILSYEAAPEKFFNRTGPHMSPTYNAGNYHDYVEHFELVVGAIRPYACEGDLADPHNRTITFAPESIESLLEKYRSRDGQLHIVQSKSDLTKDGPKLLIHIEWADVVDSVDTVKKWHEGGVRSFGWTWNQDTSLSGANTGEQWLTDLGHNVLAAMNERGMIIDTAHMSRKGMEEILRLSQKPILNSHSNARALQNHSRNLPDEIIDLFPKNGGVIGLNIYHTFITDEPEPTMDRYLDHIDYIIRRIGSDHVALGTDRHGIPIARTVQGLDNVTGVALLQEKVTDRFGAEVAQKFFHDNALRVLESNLK